jgi:fibronectin type 3 domain-containing protein
LKRPRTRRASALRWHFDRLEERSLLSLVAAYAFDEGAGTTTADGSGTGNTGTLSNAAWTTAGKYGGALSFNGTNSVVVVHDATSLHLTTGMTLEAWVDPTSLNSPDAGWCAAIAKDHVNSSNDIAYALYAANGTGTPPAGHVLIGSSDRGVQGSSVLPLNTWTFLATTYDGATQKIYVNGTLVRSRSQTGSMVSTTDSLKIGGDWSGEMFTGLIDNVRVYNTALAQSAIQTDMTTPINPPAPDTTPPTVAVTSPANGATVGGTVTVSANATDNVAVASVQFQLDGSNLGSPVTTAPYSVSWNTTTAGAGNHSLTAIATDTSGNSATSAPVAVVVNNADTTPPTVGITSPANGATVGGTINVTANATDNVAVASVQFQLDGANLGSPVATAPYSISWNTTGATAGNHTLTAIATDTSGNAATSSAVSVIVSNSDTIPPTVSMTAPLAGSTVSGSVTVSANASDNVGVVGVQFLLNGNPLGSEVTAAPYSISWDTTTVVNGSYALSAVARDAAGNQATSSTESVAVSNATANPAVTGQWSSVMNWPLVAINMVQLDTGKILMWDGGPDCIGATSATLWDPATGNFTPVPSEPVSEVRDLFCSGQTVLPDGRVLVAGGHDCTSTVYVGQAMGNIFDPATQQWTQLPDMAYHRWYPTATTLPDGRALVTAGADTSVTSYVPIPEIYDPSSNTWTQLNAANQTIPDYPFVFVLPDGRVLAAGSDESPMATYALNVATQQWTVVDPQVLDAASGVMYLPGKIMKAGASYRSAPPDNGGNAPSSPNTYVLDMTQPTPTWHQTASMANPRTHLNLTILPDDTVLATGGSSDIGGVNPAHAVYAAEMWSPTTQAWTTMASEQVPRLYHSTALLLPDGRVLEAGGGHNYFNNIAYPSAEIYSPPYLFKGARPTVTSAPSNLSYNSSFFVGTPDGASITSVALIANGSVTHAFNMDQRLVPLTFSQTAGGLTVNAPANANLAPPGYYMLFLVNSNGVPSVAPFVHMQADTQPPTAPTNLVATPGAGSVGLTWTASTDNVGVIGYDVYRSTTSGFTPSAANRVAHVTGTSYTDPVSPGTYYYKVTASDASGNVSSASNEAPATVTTGAGTIRMIQHATSGSEASGSQISVAFPSNVAAGDFLVITGTAARPSQAITITDSAGNTFVPALGPVTDPAQDVTAYVWYVASARGGPDTVTLTPNVADALEIHVSEWSGVSPTSPLDQTSFATGNGSQISSGAKTTTQNGELIFGYTFPNQNASAGAGFTGLSLVNGDLDEYQIQSTAGSVAATFTQQSDTWLAVMATFKPASLDTQPPGPPSGLAATGGVGSVGLTWSPATDNVGVAGYRIYRSTTSGFTPSSANLVGSTAATSFTDNVPAGTYYYLVTAFDAAGNEGAPSNQASATATADTQPPTVAITSPAAGATVAGSVSLTATASDNVAVASVQFLLDGNPLGSAITAAPYTYSWNSLSASNGPHTLTAIAKDAAGNATTSAPISVTVNNTSLVASYAFSEGVGTTTADGSGQNNTGTLSNASWSTAGKYGDAVSFNGSNAAVVVNDSASLHLTAGMTLEAWINPSSLSSPDAGWCAVVAKDHVNSSNDVAYALYAAQGTGTSPGVHVLIGSTDYGVGGGGVVPLNSWTFLTGTYDGSTLKMYVNGALVGSLARPGTIVTTADPLKIGGDWSGEMFTGLIDNVRIYNVALTQAQIQSDMSAGLSAMRTLGSAGGRSHVAGPPPSTFSPPVILGPAPSPTEFPSPTPFGKKSSRDRGVPNP